MGRDNKNISKMIKEKIKDARNGEYYESKY